MTSFYRLLNPSETAFTYCNEQSPLSVVIVISYRGEVTDEMVHKALQQLQERHFLLGCRISNKRQGYFFEKTEPPAKLPVQLIFQEQNVDWKNQTEKILNTKFDTNGPLLHCYILPKSADTTKGEILLHIHHAIIDGISARLILSDFLQLLGGLPLESIPVPTIKNPAYPASFRKWSGLSKRVRFIIKQMLDELKFFRKGLNTSIPNDDQNAILSMQLDRELSTKVLRKAGKLHISPNSLISATLLHAIYQHQKINHPILMRTVGFADLRKLMVPPVEDHELGCHTAMVRFSIPVSAEDSLIQTAKALWSQMYTSGKKGDLYFYSQLSPRIIEISFKLKRFRLANSALSYIGPLKIKKNYGPIEIMDIKTYITNNRLGPSLTVFGKYLFGKIGLDLNYLSSELKEDEVLEIIRHIKVLLKDIT